MEMATKRTTRSQTRTKEPPENDSYITTLAYRPAEDRDAPEATSSTQQLMKSSNTKQLPSTLTRKITQLNSQDHRLMLLKQQGLHNLDLPNTSDKQDRFVNRSSSSDARQKQENTDNEGEAVRRVCAATFIFASESAGTAICIDSSGLLLTCAHCVAESEEQYQKFVEVRKLFWLLAASGMIVQARCVAWDETRDLALLQVISAQFESEKYVQFNAVNLASSICRPRTAICCVGHPGSEDLEAEQAGIATDYPVLAISEGRFLGYAAGQNVQDNSEIGVLKHDAWTYWGHSGAPFIGLSNGNLVGLHSSWDDTTGTRRGVSIEAIHSFLNEARFERRSS